MDATGTVVVDAVQTGHGDSETQFPTLRFVISSERHGKTLVACYANRSPADGDVEAYERLAQKDLESGLTESETIQSKSAVERTMR